MCVWILYGGSYYYMHRCNVHFDGMQTQTHAPTRDSILNFRILAKLQIYKLEKFTDIIAAFRAIGDCNSWIGWVMANALLHMSWVILLTACQTYQVICLGMTTNERMNRGRYRHFQTLGGQSPFTRGPLNNLIDFLDCTCFGLFKPKRIDWMNFYEFDMNPPNKITTEQQPLLLCNGVDETSLAALPPSHSYQYV